jgi:kynurenine formamidase
MVDRPTADGVFESSRREWGRWGEDDEIGRANLLNAQMVVEAAALIRSGKRFSLALPLCSPGGDPCLPGRMNAVHYMTQDASDYAVGRVDHLQGGMQYADDSLIVACHGTTHMDALGHAFHDNTLWNGYDAGTTTGGLTRAGIGALAQRGVVGRAVLVDIPRHEEVEHLAMHRRISLDDIRGTLDAQRTAIRPGDTLILRTGIFKVFYEHGPQQFYAEFDEPGVTYEPELIDFLAEHDIAGLGTDTICNEQQHSADLEAAFPLHVLLQRNLGIIFHEALWLESWAEDCAQDGDFDAFYVAAPLNVVHGSGAPMNPIVIK